MRELQRVGIPTPQGIKTIAVLQGDILELNRELDVMTVSAYHRSYQPSPRTMILALEQRGISVRALAQDPKLDLREFCDVWLSRKLTNPGLPIRRIGCMELGGTSADQNPDAVELGAIAVIRSYFRMLDLASLNGIRLRSLGLLIPGAGRQGFSDTFVSKPVIRECLQFLNYNESIREINVIERDPAKAEHFAWSLRDSYSILQSHLTAAAERRSTGPLAFLSYASADKNIADNLCAKLEARGIRVWYAPRDVDASNYASAIVKAIGRSTHFIVILSGNSLSSEHVLNEIDLGFQEIRRGIRFYPLKLDSNELGPSFRYYLSRQHWMDATIPPLEQRLEEFAEKIRREL